MLFALGVILAVLPYFAAGFTCVYNNHTISPNNTAVWEYGNHEFLQFTAASLNIIGSSTNFSQVTSAFGERVHFINDIFFQGKIRDGSDHAYDAVNLQSLTGYRYNYKRNGNCKITFLENRSRASDINPIHESAILRLAESCIQSHVCRIDLNEVDKDGDLSYQSTQSVLNAFVDFAVMRTLNGFIDDKGGVRIMPMDLKVNRYHVSQKGGYVSGLNFIQRTRDILIEKNGNEYDIELGFRFEDLRLNLFQAYIRWGIIQAGGNIKAKIEQLSFLANLKINLQPSSCAVTLQSFTILGFKNIQVDVPVMNLFAVRLNLNSDSINRIENFLLVYVNSVAQNYTFDCQEYVDRLSTLL